MPTPPHHWPVRQINHMTFLTAPITARTNFNVRKKLKFVSYANAKYIKVLFKLLIYLEELDHKTFAEIKKTIISENIRPVHGLNVKNSV